MRIHPTNGKIIDHEREDSRGVYIHFKEKNPLEFYEKTESSCSGCNECKTSLSTNRYKWLAGENAYCSQRCYDLSQKRFPSWSLVEHAQSGLGIFVYTDRYYKTMCYCLWERNNEIKRNYREIVLATIKERMATGWSKKTMSWVNAGELKILNKWRYEMNEVIINAFPKTRDAVLIDKHFGHKLDDPLFALLIKGKEKELLGEATRLEKDEKEKKD